MEIAPYDYDADGNLTLTPSVWTATTFKPDTNSLFMRLSFRKPDNSAITLDDLAGIKIVYPTKISTDMIEDGAVTAAKLADDVKELLGHKTIVAMFMGQSNMGGRGDNPADYPKVEDGAGFEFKAISDPTKLYPLQEPFGANENKASGISEPGAKTGSMVAAFVNELYNLANVTTVGVSASKGGSTISEWQPNGPFLDDSIARLGDVTDWLDTNDYPVNHKYMFWLQGESDGDSGTSQSDYIEALNTTITAMENAGIEHTFLIRIGNYNGTGTQTYSEIMQAQTEFCKTRKNVTLISTTLDKFKQAGLMKDDFHYTQKAYNILGEDVAHNLAEYFSTGKEPMMYDWTNSGLYFSSEPKI